MTRTLPNDIYNHTFFPILLASALAIMVLPVPGAPWKRMTIPAPYVIASSIPIFLRHFLYASKLLTVLRTRDFCSLLRMTLKIRRIS